MTSRPVYALFPRLPVGIRFSRAARNTPNTPKGFWPGVAGRRRKCLILRGYFPTYSEYSGYSTDRANVRACAHEVSGWSIRSIRSIRLKLTAFPDTYREREILQSLLRCVCVCSIIPSYPWPIVSSDTVFSVSADLGEALEPQAQPLTAGLSRTRIIPCRFNHCHTVSSLSLRTRNDVAFCLDCTDRSQNGIFCNVSYPIDITRVSGRGTGAGTGRKVSHGMRKWV